MATRLSIGFLGLVLVLGGCVDSVIAPPDHGDEALEYALSFEAEPIRTLSETHLTLHVADEHGEAMMGIDGMEIQYRPAGGAEWAAIPMTIDGSTYAAHYTFMSSGDFEFRVMGEPMHQEDDHGGDHHSELEMMHEFHDDIHVERAHIDAGGYRVEYESFPGNVHAGQQVTLRFWVMEEEGDMHGSHTPIPGLTPTIRCVESDGMIHSFPGSGMMPGTYEASHTIDTFGDTRVALLYTGKDSNPAMAEFEIHVED